LSYCKKCFARYTQDRAIAKKLTLVSEFGGACMKCGYNKEVRILNFHHVDASTKEFSIGTRHGGNIAVLRAEAKKCILLCPNCHMEHHLAA
jgi:hypothetical protein